MAVKHEALRKAVIETARAMNASGLNQGTSGNVSARVDGGFVITPSGIPYDDLTPSKIVPTDMEGGFSGRWKPSSEWRMHADIYKARAEAMAVIHTHSAHATALSCLRKNIPPFHYMIAVAGGKTIRCSDYATFGTQALSDTMIKALKGRSACLLANHGMICFGPTLEKALWLAGEVEALCKQYVIARQVGKVVRLTDAEMDEALERFKTYGKQELE